MVVSDIVVYLEDMFSQDVAHINHVFCLLYTDNTCTIEILWFHQTIVGVILSIYSDSDPEVIKLFSCSTQLRLKFRLSIKIEIVPKKLKYQVEIKGYNLSC